MSSLGRRIALGRKGRNMTQKQLADHFNIRPAAVSQWENDQTRPDSARLAELAKVLGSTVEYLETGLPPGPPSPSILQRPNPPIEDVLPHGARAVRYGERTLPIFGAGQAGAEGFVNHDPSQAVDWSYTPPELIGVRDAFGLYVDGDSMTDAGLPEGTLVHVHPHRRPRPGQFCVVVKTDGSVFIKRYVGLRGGKMLLVQSNPAREIDIPETQVRAIFLITSAVFA
jgi:SOS-response transcriptional repressor LexA